jgi:shikimate kinase
MSTSVYLITGPSGSGKTTLSEYLTTLGYQSVEADSTPGLCYFVNKNNKPVPYPAQADEAWWDTHNYVWELNRMRKLIRSLPETAKPVFVCGNAGNIKDAWDMFTKVFYLDIPEELMMTRIGDNSKDHSFGKRVDESAQLVRWRQPFKTQMQELGATLIDATKPIKQVAEQIIKLAS